MDIQKPLIKKQTKSSWFLKKTCKNTIPRWVVLLSTFIVLLGLILIGLYIILPDVVQGFVDDGMLEFHSLDIVTPQAQGFKFTSSFGLSNSGPVSAKIGAMNLNITVASTQIGVLDLPSIDTSKNNFTIDSEFHIKDYKGFTEFLEQVIKQESVKWHAKVTKFKNPKKKG